MGRRGHVQNVQAKYDTSARLSDWAQATAVAYLRGKGINVYTGDRSGVSDPAFSDHWEIEIPLKRTGRGKCAGYAINTAKMDRIIADLRKHPGRVKSEDGDGEYGDQLAGILEVGMKAALEHGYWWIMVDFW